LTRESRLTGVECGFNRSVKKYSDARASFNWDLDNFILLQTREIGGKDENGRGIIITIPEECLTIEEAQYAYPEIIEAIKEQCKRILRKLGESI